MKKLVLLFLTLFLISFVSAQVDFQPDGYERPAEEIEDGKSTSLITIISMVVLLVVILAWRFLGSKKQTKAILEYIKKHPEMKREDLINALREQGWKDSEIAYGIQKSKN